MTMDELNEIRTRYTGGEGYDYLQARLDILTLLDEIEYIKSDYEYAIDGLTTENELLRQDAAGVYNDKTC